MTTSCVFLIFPIHLAFVNINNIRTGITGSEGHILHRTHQYNKKYPAADHDILCLSPPP
jgi:hypothetical protein